MRQINILTLVVLVSVIGLAACDSRAVMTSVVPTPVSIIPTATFQPASTQMPTVTPSPTPTIMPVTPLPFSGVPELVWLRYGYGTYADSPNVLSVRNGIPAYELSPVHIAHFWDYGRWSGRLAFSAQGSTAGAQQWGIGMSDLWVYDYTTGEVGMWFPDLVGGAAWSPVPDPETGREYLAVAVFNPNYRECSNCYFDIEILSGRDQIKGIIPKASPHFTWSPESQWIAFLRSRGPDEGVYVARARGGEPIKIAPLSWIDSIYDRPVWAWEHGAVFYPRGGIRVALVDGSDNFPILMPDSQPVFVKAQYAMLWSPQRRLLILAGEGGMETPPQVVAYELSEDLRTVVDSYVIGEGVTLVGWLVPDETLILTSYGQIVIWSLEDRAPVAPSQ